MIENVRIRELLSRVPRPPDEPLPAGVDDRECDGFSNRTGIRLPPEMRYWLAMSNGPCVGPGGLFGVGTGRKSLDIESYLGLYPGWRADGWVPIAGDGCGNYYLLITGQDYGAGFPVAFVDPSIDRDKPAFLVASRLGAFLVFLLERELGVTGWPFDEASVIQADPDIRRFRGIALPWEAD